MRLICNSASAIELIRPKVADGWQSRHRRRAAIYAFVDRHPTALGNAGRFMLWAMRGWVQSVASKSCPPRARYRGFASLGAAPALADFHIAMVLLHRSASQAPAMGKMDCCRIHEDEAVLLSVWHGVAEENGALVSGTLEHIVKPDAVKPVARAMAACSTKLMLAGFDLAHVATPRTAE